MKINFLFVLILFLSLNVSAQNVSSFSWMAGCWQFTEKDSGNIVTEQWMKPLGDTMMGMSRTVSKGKTREYEFARIISNEKGIFYAVRPGAAKEVTLFKLTKSGADLALFENPDNDFPQKITYQLKNKNSLFAQIEGTMDGKLLKVDFPYKRIKCE